MDNVKHASFKDWLWRTAMAIMVICLAEGFIYYSKVEDDWALMVFLNIQNAIKAYKIDPDIKIAEVFSFVNTYPLNLFEIVVSYVYCLAVIAAPFCTVAALTMLLSSPLKYLKGLSNRGKQENLLLLGEGETKKQFVKTAPKSKYNVYSVERSPIDDQKKIRYLESGIRMYVWFSDVDFQQFLKKVAPEKQTRILLCDDDPLRNLSMLRELARYYSNLRKAPTKRPTIYITCDDPGIQSIIATYFDSLIAVTEKDPSTGQTKTVGWKPAFCDLYCVDLKCAAASAMFEAYPIYRYNQALIEGNLNREITKSDLDVHMAILGFGEFGQKTLLEAMNLAVLSAESSIIFDVFDKDIRRILGCFLKNFSTEVLDHLEPHPDDCPSNGAVPYKVLHFSRNTPQFATDGVLKIRFWESDVDKLDFFATFSTCQYEMPFTYIVVAMDMEKRMVSAVAELNSLIPAYSDREVKPTVVIRVKESGDVFSTLDQEQGYIFPFRESEWVYSIERMENDHVMETAKSFHFRYSALANEIYSYCAQKEPSALRELLHDDADRILPLSQEIPEENDRDRVETKWLQTKFFNRESSIAQSKHQVIKQWLYTGDISRHLSQAMSTKEYKERLEHRRWNLFMISHGYAYAPKRDDSKRLHDCIVSFDDLIEQRPDVLEYDFTPYRML